MTHNHGDEGVVTDHCNARIEGVALCAFWVSASVAIGLVQVPYIAKSSPHLFNDPHAFECLFEAVSGRLHSLHRRVASGFGRMPGLLIGDPRHFAGLP